MSTFNQDLKKKPNIWLFCKTAFWNVWYIYALVFFSLNNEQQQKIILNFALLTRVQEKSNANCNDKKVKKRFKNSKI